MAGPRRQKEGTAPLSRRPYIHLVPAEDYAASLGDYERLIELEPDNVDAMFYRATILHKLGRRQEAVAGYSGVLEQKPQHSKALYNRAVCYSEQGSIPESIGAQRLAPGWGIAASSGAQPVSSVTPRQGLC